MTIKIRKRLDNIYIMIITKTCVYIIKVLLIDFKTLINFNLKNIKY